MNKKVVFKEIDADVRGNHVPEFPILFLVKRTNFFRFSTNLGSETESANCYGLPISPLVSKLNRKASPNIHNHFRLSTYSLYPHSFNTISSP